jgi:uncharacterized protein involved in exopolysaccharide biosynthesis
MENQENEYYQDEIDFYELFLVIKERWWIVVIVTLFSFGMALTYAYLTPAVYRISNILVINQFNAQYRISNIAQGAQDIISSAEIKEIIMNLNNLSMKQQEKELGLDKTVIQNILNINISPIQGATNSLKIKFDAFDKESGGYYMNALPGYVNKKPYIIKRIKSLIKLTRKDMDDMKRIIDDPIGSLNLSGNSIIMSSELFLIRERYNQLKQNLDELESGQVFSFADITIIPEKPYKPKKMMISMIGLVVGIILGIFLSFFIEWQTNIRLKHESQ